VESFNVGGPAHAVYYLMVDGDKGTVLVEGTAVIGWIVKRHHHDDGDIGDVIEAGVLNTDLGVVETPEEWLDNCTGVELIGLYAAGEEPSEADLDLARWTLREDLLCKYDSAAELQEPHRTRRRDEITRMGKALATAQLQRDEPARALRAVDAGSVEEQSA
jgi:hypothetical protein